MRVLITALLCLTLTGLVWAQSADTVYVPAELEGGDPYYDSLIDFIVADTNAAGEQNHLVYKLERGKFYIINKAVTLRNPVHIVADPPIADDPEGTPPKIGIAVFQSSSVVISWSIRYRTAYISANPLFGS